MGVGASSLGVLAGRVRGGAAAAGRSGATNVSQATPARSRDRWFSPESLHVKAAFLIHAPNFKSHHLPPYVVVLWKKNWTMCFGEKKSNPYQASQSELLERFGGPRDRAGRTVEVRHTALRCGDFVVLQSCECRHGRQVGLHRVAQGKRKSQSQPSRSRDRTSRK